MMYFRIFNYDGSSGIVDCSYDFYRVERELLDDDSIESVCGPYDYYDYYTDDDGTHIFVDDLGFVEQIC